MSADRWCGIDAPDDLADQQERRDAEDEAFDSAGDDYRDELGDLEDRS